MAFTYEFGADTALLESAVTKYSTIATNFSTAYELAKVDLESLKTQLDANGTQEQWSLKIQKVLTNLADMDAALKTNAANLGKISSHVTDMANKMQTAITNM